jgi:hypothetical protein
MLIDFAGPADVAAVWLIDPCAQRWPRTVVEQRLTSPAKPVELFELIPSLTDAKETPADPLSERVSESRSDPVTSGVMTE